MSKFILDIDAKYDHDYNFDFQENLTRFTDDIYQYVNYGNIQLLSTCELITIKQSNNKQKLIDAIEYIEGACDESLSKDDLISYIYDIDFIKLYEPSWNRHKDISEILDITMHYEVISSHGYSQGDLVDIIIPHILKDTWGISKKLFLNQMDDLKIELSHYLWDSVIIGEASMKYTYYHNCVTFNIDIETEELYEILDSPYEPSINTETVLFLISSRLVEGMTLSEEDKNIIRKESDSFDYKSVGEDCLCA